MLTIYRLLVTLILVGAIAAPRVRDDMRVFLGIAIAAGLIMVWDSGRKEGGQSIAQRSRPWVITIAFVLAGAAFVAVWRALSAA